MRPIDFAPFLLAIAFSVCADMPSSNATMPAENTETDCTALLSDAEASFDRGHALNRQKRWRDAVPELRETGAQSASILARCPGQAARGKQLADNAAVELRIAETNTSHQLDCQPQLDKALELDIRAATARREARDPADIERLLGEAEKHWRNAVDACQSPHREKAERGLKSTVRARAGNAELLSNGPACDNAWKNAGTLNELARNAWKEKQWEEATELYDKTALAWEVASQKCAGAQQQKAEKKAEQAQLDTHNAEHCGPQWELATEASQKLKVASISASLAERDQLSTRAEIAWREAINICRGAPQSLAKTNADALARERGAPLSPAAMALVGKNIPANIPLPAKAANLASATAPVGKNTNQNTVPTTVAPPAVVATAQPSTGSAPAIRPSDDQVIVAGDTVYRGKFSGDPTSGRQTGNGQVEWANGDRYVGDLVAGQRQGKGKFTWASGQWYDGVWQQDIATGQGMIAYTNGNRYEGEVSNGQPHGRGTLKFASGDRYVGNFTQGTFNGQGTYFWKDGDRYDGSWVLGQKHGTGRFTWSHGGGWEGEYRNDQRTDNGKQFAAVDGVSATQPPIDAAENTTIAKGTTRKAGH